LCCGVLDFEIKIYFTTNAVVRTQKSPQRENNTIMAPNHSNGIAATHSNQKGRHGTTPPTDVEVPYGSTPIGFIAATGSNDYDGPVDLDELFAHSSRNQYEIRKDPEEDSLFDDDDDEDDTEILGPQLKYFNNPHKRLLDNDASLIPGSPFSKPAMKRSNRPSEPLAMAKVRVVVVVVVTFCLFASFIRCTLFYQCFTYSSRCNFIYLFIHSTHPHLLGC
jgi:hypothetical protein